MLSIFKKKEPKLEPKKEVKTMYKCQAVDYLQVLDHEDSDKEYLLEYYTKQNKVYSLDDIHKMTEKLGVDVWNSFIWLNVVDVADTENKSIRVSIVDRLSPTTNPEMLEILKDHLNLKDFYHRSDIQKVSATLGFDVWGNCNWDKYRLSTLVLKNKDLTYKYYTKI